MPIIKGAAKKLRHDRARTKQTKAAKTALVQVVKNARKSPTAKNITAAYKSLDKAAKLHLIHGNKASRLKSRLSKLLKKK